MINPNQVVAHVLRAFDADPEWPPMSHPAADGERAVGILRVPGCPGAGLDSWATIQASDFATPHALPDGRPVRVEFVAAVDARFTRFGGCVAVSAFELRSRNNAAPGTVYRNAVAGAYRDATTPHLFSVAPFVWDAPIESFDDADAHVTWLQLVPITADEAAFVTAHGPQALEDAFMQAQPDLFSLQRASVPLEADGP